MAGELNELQLPYLFHYNIQQRQIIQDQILPDSIVSIDIGIRNLAWVELSKEGEILRWSVVDLLAPDNYGNSSADTLETLEESASIVSTKKPVGSTTTTAEVEGTPVRKSRQRKSVAPKMEALPYDLQLVAARLDRVLNEILPESKGTQTPQKIVIERQRYRSAGMHQILDATIRCAVVEGMIHCWVAAWNMRNGHRSWQSSDDLNGIHEGEGRDTPQKDNVFIEAIPPKAVAQLWGIGQVSARKGSPSDKVVASELDPPKENPPVSIKYYRKKVQSSELVSGWLESEAADLSTAPSGPSRLRVWCSSAMKAWFRAEKKKDDLSDCLLQAVAWYEWRTHAIQEALDWSVVVPEEKKAKVKKPAAPRKTREEVSVPKSVDQTIKIIR